MIILTFCPLYKDLIFLSKGKIITIAHVFSSLSLVIVPYVVRQPEFSADMAHEFSFL